MEERKNAAALPGITRRDLLRGGLAVGAASVTSHSLFAAQDSASPVLHERPAMADRRFRSTAVEETIAQVKAQIADPQLAVMFENCLPNTLDTTVTPDVFGGKPDTFVITGDIDAMWMRDSSAQMWPYLQFCKQDPRLADLIEGVMHRHARCIALDPYANAFLRSPAETPLSWSVHDETEMKPGVGERKWEVDSLCYPIRLAHGYWQATGNVRAFDAEWKQAAQSIVKTFREQQRKTDHGPYHFQRASPRPTETLALGGYGNPALPVGMIFSMFRPSDDACIYPLFVPANLFAVQSLQQLAAIADQVYHDPAFAQECHQLAAEVSAALERYGRVRHGDHGTIWAYEVDGYGGQSLMDDANAPGILSLSYLGCSERNDPLYRASRSFVLSKGNPYFFAGTAAEGIGGPHQGLDYIWPMSIVFRAFSSTSDAETLQCLRWLRNTTAGTNFMHESFHKDDPAKYTRPWFAWANGLFGELILHLAKTSPGLLRQSLS
jgi:meiotically up-regulated gene 157 (Mug157) protein